MINAKSGALLEMQTYNSDEVPYLGENVRVGARVNLGNSVYLQGGNLIEHDVQIGDGAIVEEGFNIGSNTIIGPGALIAGHVGSNCVVGQQAIVLANLAEGASVGKTTKVEGEIGPLCQVPAFSGLVGQVIKLDTQSVLTVLTTCHPRPESTIVSLWHQGLCFTKSLQVWKNTDGRKLMHDANGRGEITNLTAYINYWRYQHLDIINMAQKACAIRLSVRNIDRIHFV